MMLAMSQPSQAYEHIGERKLAASRYEDAAKAFPQGFETIRPYLRTVKL